MGVVGDGESRGGVVGKSDFKETPKSDLDLDLGFVKNQITVVVYSTKYYLCRVRIPSGLQTGKEFEVRCLVSQRFKSFLQKTKRVMLALSFLFKISLKSLQL